MNTKIIYIGLLSIIIGGIGWIVYPSVLELLESKNTEVGLSSTQAEGSLEKTTAKKIPRRISYLGRIEEAKKLMDHQYFSLATSEIAEAIKEKPDFIEPYLLLAEIYLRTGDVWKLENLLEEMRERFPNDPELTVIKTRQFINARKFADVLSLLNEVEENLLPELQFYKAVLLSLQNDHEGTKAILKELQKIPVDKKDFVVTEDTIEQKTDEEKYVLAPEIGNKISKFAIAYEEFETLSEGKNAHLFATLSKILAENNEAVLGREFADTAIKEDVSYIDAWILRGYTELLLENTDSAEEDLRHAYELDPLRPETQYFLALALYEQKKYTEAALFFEKALDYNFEFSAEVRWKLLEIFSIQKKYDQVINLYKQLLDYDADSQKFVSAVHTAVDLLKKPEVALEFSEILIEKNPDDVFALNIHGWALIANTQYVLASQTLEKAKTLAPSNPRTYLNLGLLYEEQSLFDKAKEMYKRCYELGKENPEYLGIVNLAVEKYNQLLEQERPESREASANPPSSP